MSAKTIFPDDSGNLSKSVFPNQAQTGAVPQQEQDSRPPIMGMLYSVSKSNSGECWPVHCGVNTIGSDETCDIQLSEMSVSPIHATLIIREMIENGESKGYLIFIKDNGSSFGTLINGNSLDLNAVECKTGDILTIGRNYELYFIFLDSKQLGLEPKKDFQPNQPVVASVRPLQAVATENNNTLINKGTLCESSSPFERKKTSIYNPNR